MTALLGLMAFPVMALGVGGSQEFCRSHVIHDYLKPLEKLPALHRPPRPQNLPFGQHGVQLLAGNSLQAGAGEIGFSLAYDRLPRPLNWLVTATLVKVRSDGDAFGRPKLKHVDVGRPSIGMFDDLYFSVPANSSLYRVDIVFRNRSGRRLGHYGQYFRVVPSRWDVRLGLSATTYGSQETVDGRIENYGTETAFYGAPYAIEKYDGSTWSVAPESPNAFIFPLYRTEVGMTGRCSSFQIPPEMPPGLYRMTKQVKGDGRRVTLSAEFELLPPA